MEHEEKIKHLKKGTVKLTKEQKKELITTMTGLKNPDRINMEDLSSVTIKGKFYKVDYDEKTHKPFLIEINKKEYDRKTERITQALIKHVNAERIIKNALSKMTVEGFEILYHNLFLAKKKAKPRERGGCVEIDVGDIAVPLAS